jgi:hypothetical protein
MTFNKPFVTLKNPFDPDKFNPYNINLNTIDFSTLTADSYRKIKDHDGNSLLHIAAKEGNIEAITEIMQLPFMTDFFNRNGEKPVVIALKAGNPDAAVACLTGQIYSDPHPGEDMANFNDINSAYERLKRASQEGDLYSVLKVLCHVMRSQPNLSKFSEESTLRNSLDMTSGDSLLTKAIHDLDPKLVAVLVQVQPSQDHDWVESKKRLEKEIEHDSEKINDAATVHWMVDFRHRGFSMPRYTSEALDALYDAGHCDGDRNNFNFRMSQSGTQGLPTDQQPKTRLITQEHLAELGALQASITKEASPQQC